MRTLHVGAAQIQSKAGDVNGNLDRMLRIVKAASCMQVEALLFSETCIYAYDFSADNLALAEPTDGCIVKTLTDWSQTYNMTILAGIIERDADYYFNTHVAALPDGSIQTQRKYSLTSVEIEAGIQPGPRKRTIIELNSVKCAILICADGGIDGIYQELIEDGVEFLFFPTAGGGKLSEYMHSSMLDSDEGRAWYTADRAKVFLSDAIIDQAKAPFPGFASSNALGNDSRCSVHRGHCAIIDTKRVLRAQIPGTNVIDYFQDQFCHARITFE